MRTYKADKSVVREKISRALRFSELFVNNDKLNIV